MYKLELKPSKTLKTKYGTAKLYKKGYYVISSKKEGFGGIFLHKLIFEDNFGKIPKGYLIHHIDSNKANNCIFNLQLMTPLEHSNTHNKGKKHSDETKTKISRYNNSTGFFRVYKRKDNSVKQGFLWVYKYYQNGKRIQISRVDLKSLEEEVKNRGLKWEKFENGDYNECKSNRQSSNRYQTHFKQEI
jgi:hypothetical protein